MALPLSSPHPALSAIAPIIYIRVGIQQVRALEQHLMFYVE